MKGFFERLIRPKKNKEEEKPRSDLESLPTAELVIRRAELEESEQIQDLPDGTRMGFAMSDETVREYNSIIEELQRRNDPSPGYIGMKDKFCKE